MRGLPLSKHKVLFNAPTHPPTHIPSFLFNCLMIQGCGNCPFSLLQFLSSFCLALGPVGVSFGRLASGSLSTALLWQTWLEAAVLGSHLIAFLLNWLFPSSCPQSLTVSVSAESPAPLPTPPAVAPYCYSKQMMIVNSFLLFFPFSSSLSAVARRDCWVEVHVCLVVYVCARVCIKVKTSGERCNALFREGWSWSRYKLEI